MSLKNKIRVLVVDDSFFMRKLLREILESDNQIEVVGTAQNSDEAVVKSKQLSPDVITMDYNLPDRNGIDTITEIFSFSNLKKPSIIMISAHALAGSDIVLDSLRAGAIDFITKPSGEISIDIDSIRDEIILKVHIASLANVKVYSKGIHKVSETKKDSLVLSEKVIVIGSSTGGPPIVEDIIGLLPNDLLSTIIVVQHMPAYFIPKFAERLDKISPLQVVEAKDGDYMITKRVYVVPTDFEFEMLESKRLKLNKESSYGGARPCINFVMESVVKAYKDKVIGIILSGMGNDGLLGARKIKQAGGIIIAQTPETTVIDSMPKAIIDEGLADEILTPKEISNRIISLVK